MADITQPELRDTIETFLASPTPQHTETLARALDNALARAIDNALARDRALPNARALPNDHARDLASARALASSLAHALDSGRARDRALANTFGLASDRARDRDRARALANALDSSLNNALDSSLNNALARARALDSALNFALHSALARERALFESYSWVATIIYGLVALATITPADESETELPFGDPGTDPVTVPPPLPAMLVLPSGPLRRVEHVEGIEPDALIREAEDLIFGPWLTDKIDQLPEDEATQADNTCRALHLELAEHARDPVVVLRLYERLVKQVGLFDQTFAQGLADEFGSDPEPFTDLSNILSRNLPLLGSEDPNVAGKAVEAIRDTINAIPDDAVLGDRTPEQFVEGLDDRQLERAFEPVSLEDSKTVAEIDNIQADTGLKKAQTLNQKLLLVTGLSTAATAGVGFAANLVIQTSSNPHIRALFKLLRVFFESAA